MATSRGKCYVQDRLREWFVEVVTFLLEKNAWVYVCGSAGKRQGAPKVMGGLLGGNRARKRQIWGLDHADEEGTEVARGLWTVRADDDNT